jgi:ketosteroid isomerase-like protein
MLKRAICAAAGVLLLSPQAGNATPRDATAVIRHLEDELTIAFNKYDAAALDRLWADDLVFVSPNGALASKAERLAGLKEVPAEIPISANESVDTKSLGDVAVAVVLSKWSGVSAGKPFATHFRATHVWAKRGGAWKLVSAHVSQVKD